MKPFDDLEKALSALLKTLPPEERLRYETHIRRTAGSIRRLETGNTLLLRERSSIHALLKKTSEDLIHRYQTLFENSGTGMAVIEDDGTVSLVNSVFEQMTGYLRGETEHLRSIFSFVVPEERERIMAYHKARRNSDETVSSHYETRIIRNDGSVLDIVVSAQVFPGTLQSIVSMMDITERKRAEEALRLAHTKLNLLSNLSRHDILNQLTVLSGYLELSKALTNEPRLLEYIRKETDVTDNITDLISFTRDYQEIGIQFPTWQDLEMTIVRATRNINPGAIRLEVVVEPVMIYADPLLERVFYNLMENALKYGRTLTRIRFSFIRSDNSGIIVCEDDGVGIPAGEKENIFQRKYFQHTGLGMYLSREILAITGITITENGEPGKGARFEIVVPEGAWRFTRTK
ncbi:MAG: PAS domain S-box protein [Methanoregula sp.]|nr:PAS domain S-box protein [Methanoregula sp.]